MEEAAGGAAEAVVAAVAAGPSPLLPTSQAFISTAFAFVLPTSQAFTSTAFDFVLPSSQAFMSTVFDPLLPSSQAFMRTVLQNSVQSPLNHIHQRWCTAIVQTLIHEHSPNSIRKTNSRNMSIILHIAHANLPAWDSSHFQLSCCFWSPCFCTELRDWMQSRVSLNILQRLQLNISETCWTLSATVEMPPSQAYSL